MDGGIAVSMVDSTQSLVRLMSVVVDTSWIRLDDGGDSEGNDVDEDEDVGDDGE